MKSRISILGGSFVRYYSVIDVAKIRKSFLRKILRLHYIHYIQRIAVFRYKSEKQSRTNVLAFRPNIFRLNNSPMLLSSNVRIQIDLPFISNRLDYLLPEKEIRMLDSTRV